MTVKLFTLSFGRK